MTLRVPALAAVHWPWWVGGLALLLAALAATGLQSRWQAERAELDARGLLLRSQLRARLAALSAPPPVASQALVQERLVADWPSVVRSPERLEALFAGCVEAGVRIVQVQVDPPGPLVPHRAPPVGSRRAQDLGGPDDAVGPEGLSAWHAQTVDWRVQASYAALRRCVGEALRRDPAVALLALQFDRVPPAAEGSARMGWRLYALAPRQGQPAP